MEYNPNKCDHKNWCEPCNQCHECCCYRCGDQRYLICECDKKYIKNPNDGYFRFCPKCCNELCKHEEVIVKSEHKRFD